MQGFGKKDKGKVKREKGEVNRENAQKSAFLVLLSFTHCSVLRRQQSDTVPLFACGDCRVVKYNAYMTNQARDAVDSMLCHAMSLSYFKCQSWASAITLALISSSFFLSLATASGNRGDTSICCPGSLARSNN